MTHETRDERTFLPAPATLELTLRYPLPWFSAGAGTSSRIGANSAHPHAPSPLAVRGWRAPGVARFGGWPVAADPQRAATALRFLTLWLVVGDGPATEAELLAAIRGDDAAAPERPGEPEGFDPRHACAPARPEPALRAWWETARRYRAAMGPGWCARLADDFADWQAASRGELAWTAKIQAGGYPSREELLQIRAAAVGAGPALDLLEYVADCPLPLAVREHPALASVRRYAARLLAIQDDVAGAAEDLAEGRPNLLGCLLRGERLRPSAAAAELEALHDESLCGLTGASQLLRAEFPRCEPLARWLREVHALCHGFARWHGHDPRRVRLPHGATLAIELEYV